jgi:hypothetical protein
MTDTVATTTKRGRSPSPSAADEPKKPMVRGVHHQGFLLESERILKKWKNNSKEQNEETNIMLESACEVLGESLVGAQESGLKGIAQAVSNLLEVAVALTSLAPKLKNEGEDEKIRLLHKHVLEGLDMIGGEKAVYEGDDE